MEHPSRTTGETEAPGLSYSAPSGRIKTRRWDDPAEPDDGFRLLVCRYRPRALPKKDETWDLWWKHLGPTPELHAGAYGKHGQARLAWDEYARRYRQEMQGQEQQDSIAVLAEKVAAGATITLLCSSACKDPAQCHRTLLKELIEEQLRRKGA
jgi:uncharacterized protein YeaO (DUF488 family)